MLLNRTFKQRFFFLADEPGNLKPLFVNDVPKAAVKYAS